MTDIRKLSAEEIEKCRQYGLHVAVDGDIHDRATFLIALCDLALSALSSQEQPKGDDSHRSDIRPLMQSEGHAVTGAAHPQHAASQEQGVLVPRELPEDGWYPVTPETMPHGGMNVIAFYLNKLGKKRTVRAFYAPRFTIEDHSDNGDGNEDSNEEHEGTVYLTEGWYEECDNADYFYRISDTVTHWRVFPPPPGQDAPVATVSEPNEQSAVSAAPAATGVSGDAAAEAYERAALLCYGRAAQYETRANELHARGPITFQAEVDRWYCRANQARRDAEAIRALSAPSGGHTAASEQRDLVRAWSPMETAPTSGIGVLLLQPWRSGHDTVLIGHYANGWVNRDCEALRPQPTGWMPLPATPNGYPYTTHKPEQPHGS